MENIKAVIFDFGGVILDIDYDKTTNAFTALGVKDFDSMYSQKKANLLFKHLEEGKINEQEFYTKFRKSTGLTITDKQIKSAWNAMLLSFRQEALKTLLAIKSKYDLYLLSNTNIIHLDAFLKIYKKGFFKISFEDHFKKVYYSHQIGYRKPDKEAYQHVLKENNLPGNEVLFIDDSIQNIEAAKAIGMQTIFLQKGRGIEDLKL